MIYATLFNGPKTCILTRDELRNHAYLMQTKEMRAMFRRWQRQNQIFPFGIVREGRNADLRVQYQVVKVVKCQEWDPWQQGIVFIINYDVCIFKNVTSKIKEQRRRYV